MELERTPLKRQWVDARSHKIVQDLHIEQVNVIKLIVDTDIGEPFGNEIENGESEMHAHVVDVVVDHVNVKDFKGTCCLVDMCITAEKPAW